MCNYSPLCILQAMLHRDSTQIPPTSSAAPPPTSAVSQVCILQAILHRLHPDPAHQLCSPSPYFCSQSGLYLTGNITQTPPRSHPPALQPLPLLLQSVRFVSLNRDSTQILPTCSAVPPPSSAVIQVCLLHSLEIHTSYSSCDIQKLKEKCVHFSFKISVQSLNAPKTWIVDLVLSVTRIKFGKVEIN